MEQNYTWLATSLFSRKNRWGNLLGEIELFVNKWMNKNHTNNYLLEFNYLSGENIRFAFLSASEHTGCFVKQMDEHFKYFFLNSGNPENEPLLPTAGIFMPFPQNTIQYGLYMPVIISDLKEIEKYSIQIELSAIIIEALRQEEINDEVILTFSYYLIIAFIIILIRNGLFLKAELIAFYSDSESNNDIECTSSKFSDNKEILFEITNSIINSNQAGDRPSWLEKWINVCEIEIKNNFLFTSQSNFMATHLRIKSLIYKHLGISGKMKFLLSYFISQTLLTDKIQDT
jgi:hypothetical protein